MGRGVWLPPVSPLGPGLRRLLRPREVPGGLEPGWDNNKAHFIAYDYIFRIADAFLPTEDRYVRFAVNGWLYVLYLANLLVFLKIVVAVERRAGWGRSLYFVALILTSVVIFYLRTSRELGKFGEIADATVLGFYFTAGSLAAALLLPDPYQRNLVFAQELEAKITETPPNGYLYFPIIRDHGDHYLLKAVLPNARVESVCVVPPEQRRGRHVVISKHTVFVKYEAELNRRNRGGESRTAGPARGSSSRSRRAAPSTDRAQGPGLMTGP